MKCVVIIATVCVAWGIVVGLCLWFPGYERATIVNKSLRPTQSTVTATRDAAVVCCTEVCSGSGKTHYCHQVCDICWDHFATFEWTGDTSVVVNNLTQSLEVFLWQDYAPQQSTYFQGGTYTIYYNICPLIPLNHDDQVICTTHGDTTPFYFVLFNALAMEVTAIISFSIGGIGVLLLCGVLVWYVSQQWYQWFTPTTATCGAMTVFMETPPPDYAHAFVNQKA